MKLALFLMLFISFNTIWCQKPLKNYENEETKDKQWKKVGNFIVSVMKNSMDNKNGSIELGFGSFTKEKYLTLVKEILKKSVSIVIESMQEKVQKVGVKDFLIITAKLQQLEKLKFDFFMDYFEKLSQEKLNKFFFIIDATSNKSSKTDGDHCLKVLTYTFKMNYKNVLCLEVTTNAIGIYKIKNVENDVEITSVPIKTKTFPIFNKKMKDLKVVQHELAPYSYIENKKVYGLEGKALDEFCRKYGLKYEIVNKDIYNHKPDDMTKHFADTENIVSFNTFPLELDRNYYREAHMNELDGLCFLAPKTIPTANKAEYFT
jgi:hypothetical protein